MECGPKCHFIISKPERNTRVYQPDKMHAKHMKDINKKNYIYSKTREEMGSEYEKLLRDDKNAN